MIEPMHAVHVSGIETRSSTVVKTGIVQLDFGELRDSTNDNKNK
jgi:hypothetical protein